MWYIRSVCTDVDFNIDKEVITVGRYPTSDLCCPENFIVSRRHAVLSVEENNLYVISYKSINGTWVNGRRLDDTEKLQLSVDDFLSFSYPEHPDCNGKGDHYYYRVMQHPRPIINSPDLLRILEGADVDPVNGIKQEPEDPEVLYSTNEEVITINDDDDFEFASSQLFNEKSIIKSEPIECIEITDGEDDDSDILMSIGLLSPLDDILEDPIVDGEVSPKDNEVSPKNNEVCTKNGEVSPMDNENLKQDENQNITFQYPKSNYVTRINENKEELTTLEEISTEKLKEDKIDQKYVEPQSKCVVDRSFIVKSKYAKPTVIPAHVADVAVRKRKKNTASEHTLDVKKQRTEHKPSDNENKGNKKKSRKGRGRPKRKPDKIKPDENHGVTNNNGYVPRSALTRINGFNKDLVKQPNNLNNENILGPTTDFENSTVPKKQTFHYPDAEPSTSKGIRATRDPRQMNVHNGVNNKVNGTIVNDDDLEGILRCHVNYNARSKPVDFKSQYPFLVKPSSNIIFAILNWNTKWLQEQQDRSVPPPIIRNDVVRMCTRFNSYIDYCNVVKPFIMLELWDNLSQGFRESSAGKKNFRTSIHEVDKLKQYQILKCIAYANDKDRKLLNRPKEGDVIIINIGIRPNPNARQAALKCLFAYVISCRSHKLKPTDYIYEDLLSKGSTITSQLELQFLLKPFPEEILVAKFVDATIISSVTSILRECDAVVNMSKSSVSNLILNPKIQNFTVERNNNIIVDKKGLSEKQIMAIQDACSLCVGNRPGLYLIQGPPGTGKTTVIQHIVENLVKAKEHIRILVVAPSNATVDGIVRKLSRLKTPKDARKKFRSDMVRLGKYDSISNDLKNYCLDEIAKKRIVQQILEERPEVRMDYVSLKETKYNLCVKLENEKRSNNKDNIEQLREQLMSIDNQINNFANHYYIENHYWKVLHEKKRDIMRKARIICATLNSCVRIEEHKLKIDCCIVDEASQSKETETLIPLSLGIEKMVLVGDPQQLPAVTLSKFAKDLEYGQSLFGRIKKVFACESTEPITVLDTQFRMHPEICNYPNKKFYKGILKTAPMCRIRGGLQGLAPYYILNLNMRNEQKDFYNNRNEINCVVKLLEAIHEIIGQKPNKHYTVGVITPYNSQRKSLLERIQKMRLPSMEVTVNTVDSFQGSEKDIIILSFVRARANPFLDDEQRLNVALTRARRVLYVVGTNPLFDTSPTLNNLKTNAESRNLYLNILNLSTLILKSLIEKKI